MRFSTLLSILNWSYVKFSQGTLQCGNCANLIPIFKKSSVKSMHLVSITSMINLWTQILHFSTLWHSFQKLPFELEQFFRETNAKLNLWNWKRFCKNYVKLTHHIEKSVKLTSNFFREIEWSLLCWIYGIDIWQKKETILSFVPIVMPINLLFTLTYSLVVLTNFFVKTLFYSNWDWCVVLTKYLANVYK